MKVKILALSAVLLGGLIAANEYNNSSKTVENEGTYTATDVTATNVVADGETETKAESSFVEGKHYTKIDEAKIKPILNELGLKDGQSFEVFSYSCPHCLMLEPVVKRLELETNQTVAKFQLGFENFPLAETQYYLNNSLKGENLERAHLELYKAVQTDGMTFEKIVEMLEVFPLGQAISDEEVEHLKPKAVEYAALTRKLAVEADISGTPALFIKGKYLVNMQSIESVDNLIELNNYLSSK